MSVFDEQSWEERYRSRSAVWSGQPNLQLMTEAAGLDRGEALDVGSGEGADALWLASRGWQVTAVDFSTTALQRGSAHAEALGADVASRIRWVHADLTTWPPPRRRFDLVSAQFMHLLRAEREALFARLAGAVAPRGTLLVVGHHPSDLQTTVPRPSLPDLYFTAEEVAASLRPDQWDVLVTDTRPHAASDQDGQAVTVHDTVLRARKRP